MATAKKQAVKEKSDKVIVYSPLGRFSYPYFTAPDTGRANSDNKFKTELMIPKAVWAKEGQEMIAAVLSVAADYFKKPKIQLKDLVSTIIEDGVESKKRRHPFTDMALEKDTPDVWKDCVRLRAKSDFEPWFIGPKKGADGKFPRLTKEEIAELKGGDYGRLCCVVYSYSQQGGGVTLGLQGVQFAHAGEAVSQGATKQIEGFSEIAVELDDPSEMVDTEAKAEEAGPLSFG